MGGHFSATLPRLRRGLRPTIARLKTLTTWLRNRSTTPEGHYGRFDYSEDFAAPMADVPPSYESLYFGQGRDETKEYDPHEEGIRSFQQCAKEW